MRRLDPHELSRLAEIGEMLNSFARPLMALMFSGGLLYMSIVGVDSEWKDAFVAVATAVILWFFKSRDEKHTQDRMQEQSDEMVELARAAPPENPAPGGSRNP
jgi:hypothetical protein